MIEPGITAVGDRAFSNFKNLRVVQLPEGLLSVGTGAFSACVELKQIALPEGVFEIGKSAFSSCVSLQSIILPESVTKLESYTFSGCVSLAWVAFGTELDTVEAYVFTECWSLRDIYYAGVDKAQVAVNENKMYGNTTYDNDALIRAPWHCISTAPEVLCMQRYESGELDIYSSKGAEKDKVLVCTATYDLKGQMLGMNVTVPGLRPGNNAVPVDVENGAVVKIFFLNGETLCPLSEPIKA